MTYWAPEDVETVKTMYLAGETYGDITKAVGKGYTRRAISGVIHRLKLPKRDSAAADRMMEKKNAHRKEREAKGIKPPTLPKMKSDLAVLPETAVSIEDASNRQCLWPYGDPSSTSFRVCGAARGHTESYCVAHRKIAYQPLKDGAKISAEDKQTVRAMELKTGIHRAFG